MESQLASAMKSNARLRVLVLSSLRDLAVPEDSMLFSVAHLPIPESLRRNITLQRYESGHMMYLYAPDAAKLRRDLTSFFAPPK
jgi:carboxypeptidase C (cathepsin A)